MYNVSCVHRMHCQRTAAHADSSHIVVDTVAIYACLIEQA